MSRLGPVLTADDLPIAELMASRLDGELAALDGAWTPIDEIEQPRHRALAIALRLPHRVIVEQHSAAWVWGARPAPPSQHQLCVAAGARVRNAEHRGGVREVIIDEEEIWTLGVARVTSPLRTAVDLVRFCEDFDDEVRGIVSELLRLGGHTVGDALAAIEQRRNLPSKRRAQARLWSVAARAGYAELTRYTS